MKTLYEQISSRVTNKDLLTESVNRWIRQLHKDIRTRHLPPPPDSIVVARLEQLTIILRELKRVEE